MNKTQNAHKNTRRHFLLLQGPNSFFFDLLARKLRGHNFKTTKINFNAGDALFYKGKNVINYKYSADDWQNYISDISKIQGVTDLILFDDRKPFHAQAISSLKETGINIHVFNSGYFDQNHITLERNGTNGNSSMPDEPMFYMRTPTIHTGNKPEKIANSAFKYSLCEVIYIITAKLSRSDKYNPDFKPSSVQLFKLFRKSFTVITTSLKQLILKPFLLRKKYFVASIDRNNKNFIRKVVSSFATHTQKRQVLIINITGKANYKRANNIAIDTAKKYRASNRVFTLHNANLSKLVKKSEGMIVFDSIDGVIALENEKPLIALGKTIFSFAGLTNQAKLLGFWNRRTSPNPSLYGKFKNHISAHTQINGNFCTRRGMELAAATASHNIIFSGEFALGNNVSENV